MCPVLWGTLGIAIWYCDCIQSTFHVRRIFPLDAYSHAPHKGKVKDRTTITPLRLPSLTSPHLPTSFAKFYSTAFSPFIGLLVPYLVLLPQYPISRHTVPHTIIAKMLHAGFGAFIEDSGDEYWPRGNPIFAITNYRTRREVTLCHARKPRPEIIKHLILDPGSKFRDKRAMTSAMKHLSTFRASLMHNVLGGSQSGTRATAH